MLLSGEQEATAPPELPLDYRIHREFRLNLLARRKEQVL